MENLKKETCVFCQKTFKNELFLKRHQSRSKLCLEKQGKTASHPCDFCEKSLSSKDALNIHLSTCKEKKKKEIIEKQSLQEEKLKNQKKMYDEKIKELKGSYEEKIKEIKRTYEEKIKDQKDMYKDMIKKLEDKIEKHEDTLSSIAQRGTTNTNHTNTTNNVVINNNQCLDLSKENVGKVIEQHLTKEVVGQGAVGLANMVCTKLLKDEDGTVKYKCIDPSRQMFGYQNNDGDRVKDMKANKLTNALVRSGNLDRKARESGEELWTKDDGEIDYERFHIFQPKVTEIINLQNDNTKFRSALTTMMV